MADPPTAAESNRCHQSQQQVDTAATVIAALYANNTALREQLAARTALVRNLDLFRTNRDYQRHRRPTMPNRSLDVGDAAELAEILQFLGEWLAAEHGGLGASLQRYVGRPAYGITQLRADLDRSIFLLGGSYGEPVFEPSQ